jgi:serine/threonine protein kinase
LFLTLQSSVSQVAVKVIKGYWDDTMCRVWSHGHLAFACLILDQKFLRELIVWSSAKHRYITPLLGVSLDFDRPGTPALMSPYFAHGNIVMYLRKNPNVDKLPLVNHCQISRNTPCSISTKIVQIAEALSYLHACEIYHGDLKGVGDTADPCKHLSHRLQNNIIVNDVGEACLTDFCQR